MAPKMFNNYAISYRASLKHNLNGLFKLWIKILFITLIFALVQTSTPPTSSIQLQKRGEGIFIFFIFLLAAFSHEIFSAGKEGKIFSLSFFIRSLGIFHRNVCDTHKR
jgi:energy-coupling factor transporter transmembrane protein EcfT